MERTAKTTWSRKRKLQTRMKRMREAKSSASTTGSVSSYPGESAASEAADESLPSTYRPSESTPTEDMHTESSESLDESVRMPVTKRLSDHDSSESSDDSSGFSNVDAHHIYKKWLQKQPRQSVQMMAVMFMDGLLKRFNMTTLGAAKEVGLLLGHNENTVRTWNRDFYDNQDHFTESKQTMLGW